MKRRCGDVEKPAVSPNIIRNPNPKMGLVIVGARPKFLTYRKKNFSRNTRPPMEFPENTQAICCAMFPRLERSPETPPLRTSARKRSLRAEFTQENNFHFFLEHNCTMVQFHLRPEIKIKT